MYCKVSHDYISILYTKRMLHKQCNHNDFIVWPPANPYMNDQFKNIQGLFSQNVYFRLNTLLLFIEHNSRGLTLEITFQIKFSVIFLDSPTFHEPSPSSLSTREHPSHSIRGWTIHFPPLPLSLSPSS